MKLNKAVAARRRAIGGGLRRAKSHCARSTEHNDAIGFILASKAHLYAVISMAGVR